MGPDISNNQINTSRKGKEYLLGIMGGTFNPIHYGHLVAAEQARAKFNLDEVVFVPSGTPPHKEGRDIIDAEHRYIITALATATNPFFSVSRAEIDRSGPSYAVDTIKFFQNQYTDRNPKLFFITGMDAVMEILSWRKPDTIMEMCTIIAATRPGYDNEKLSRAIGKNNMEAIKLLEASALAISSTDIRNRIAAGLPVRYLLPETVEQYIKKHGLYSK